MVDQIADIDLIELIDAAAIIGMPFSNGAWLPVNKRFLSFENITTGC